MEKYLELVPCSSCHGKRLRPEALAVKVGGFQDSIADNAVYFKNKIVEEYNKVKEAEGETTTTTTTETTTVEE